MEQPNIQDKLDNQVVRYGGHYSASREEPGNAPGSTMTDITKRIIQLKWGCFQIFFGSQKSYNRKKPTPGDCKTCKALLDEHNIGFYTHFPYILNLTKLDGRIDSLQTELTRISLMSGRCVVHPNSYTDAKHANKAIAPLLKKADPTSTDCTKIAQWRADYMKAIDNIVANIGELNLPATVDCPLLLEPPAGEGKKFGWCMEQLRELYARLPAQVGLCIDTCHLFAAGECRFDTMQAVDEFFAELDDAVGLQKVKLVHLNDSLGTFGCMTDNHAPLCRGFIWSDEANFAGLIRLWELCKKHNIDVVSEVSSAKDHEVMSILSNLD